MLLGQTEGSGVRKYGDQGPGKCGGRGDAHRFMNQGF